ncbi:hypothetical protein PG996_007237 [Apiospora saccharicola]|uniref:BZIP domain-containing protein n=1 Tax=Apiospora saccharicola TaxID=335842 RepID=A0ABR1VA87_9PEZI
MKIAGKEKVDSPPRETPPPAEQSRYNALIAKLNRRSGSDPVEDAKSRHSMSEGQFGMLGDAVFSKAGSTLNPKASEFTVSEFPKQYPATFSQPSAPTAGRPSVLDFFEPTKDSCQVPDLNPKAIDDLRAWGRVFLDLLDAISHDEGQREKLMSSLGDGRFPPELLPPPGWQPNLANLEQQQPLSEWPIPQSAQLTSGIQPIPGYGDFMPPVPAGLGNDINAYLLAAREGLPPTQALGNAGGHAAAVPPPVGLQAPIGMQTNLQPNAPFAPQPGMTPFPISQAPTQAANRPAPNMPQQPGLAGPQNSGIPRANAYTHGFGPTPVSKPKGPARPNDPRWCKQQMMYEAYLEWQRSTDTSYHKKCKDRQAKRAERQRGSKDRQRNEGERLSSEGAVEVSA